MELNQNDLERIKDMLDQGIITAAQANVEMIRCQRVKLITTRVPKDVRKALNNAVKKGELGHVRKVGRKPEAYYHPTFEYMVAGERNACEIKILEALRSVCT